MVAPDASALIKFLAILLHEHEALLAAFRIPLNLAEAAAPDLNGLPLCRDHWHDRRVEPQPSRQCQRAFREPDHLAVAVVRPIVLAPRHAALEPPFLDLAKVVIDDLALELHVTDHARLVLDVLLKPDRSGIATRHPQVPERIDGEARIEREMPYAVVLVGRGKIVSEDRPFKRLL